MFEMYRVQHAFRNFGIYEFNEINLIDCTVQSQKLASTSTNIPATILGYWRFQFSIKSMIILILSQHYFPLPYMFTHVKAPLYSKSL